MRTGVNVCVKIYFRGVPGRTRPFWPRTPPRNLDYHEDCVHSYNRTRIRTSISHRLYMLCKMHFVTFLLEFEVDVHVIRGVHNHDLYFKPSASRRGEHSFTN